MPEQLVHQRLVDSIDLKYQWAEALARPIDDGIQALLACVTGGGRVLCCGSGASAALAQYMAALLVGGLERPRPELPALALGADVVLVLTLAARGDPADVLAAQVRAVGGPDDVLLVLTADGQSDVLVHAIEAAHERDMVVVALTGNGGGPVGEALRDTDVHVAVPSDSISRVHETHQLVLHGLCHGLDQQLLGDEDLSI